MFLVSKKLASVESVVPGIGKLSPVKIERSALKSEETVMKRKSAGIF
jgi:hypothetical protein